MRKADLLEKRDQASKILNDQDEMKNEVLLELLEIYRKTKVRFFHLRLKGHSEGFGKPKVQMFSVIGGRNEYCPLIRPRFPPSDFIKDISQT